MEAGLGGLKRLLGAFKWSCALPERFGDVPGGSRSVRKRKVWIFEGFTRFSGGGEAKDAHARANPNAAWPGPLNTSKLQLPQATYHFPLRSDHFDRRRPMGKYHLAPTHTVAQSAVADKGKGNGVLL